MNVRKGAIVLLFVVMTQSVMAEGITITTDDNYPPITSTTLEYGGLGMRVVNRAFELSGQPVQEILWLPWARGYQLTKLNAIDVAFPWGAIGERYKDFLFSDPFINMVNNAYVSRDATVELKTQEDLKNKKYCNPNGYGDFGIIKDYNEAGLLKRETPLNMVLCFKMLALHRVDFVIAPVWDAAFAMDHVGVDPGIFRREPVKVAETPLGLIVAKDNEKGPQIIEAFNHGLAMMRKSGELKALFEYFDFLDHMPQAG